MSRPLKRRKLEGIRFRPKALIGYVKVGGRQVAKSFPATTEPDKIQEWRLQTRRELRKGQPEKGTLAADIERYLNTLPDRLPNGQRNRGKIDANAWLKKWTDSPLGKQPRGVISRQDMAAQLLVWQQEGYSGASLNHLRQAVISLWRELDGPDHTCPAKQIAKFRRAAPRQGFFEAATLIEVLKHLSPDYADVVQFAYFSGWRRQEIQQLQWDEVDLAGGVIRLSPERSKNRDGRVLPIVGPLVELMKRRAENRADSGLPYVFTRVVGGKRTPKRHVPVGDWRKAWKAACKAAKCEGALLHDFRRTVVRNLTRAGVPEPIAMAWTGHKTRSVFDRYNIVNEADLQAAGERLAGFVGHSEKPQSESGEGTETRRDPH